MNKPLSWNLNPSLHNCKSHFFPLLCHREQKQLLVFVEKNMHNLKNNSDRKNTVRVITCLRASCVARQVCSDRAPKTYLDENALMIPFPALISRYLAFRIRWGMGIKVFFSQRHGKGIICMGNASWGEGNICLHSGKVSQDVKRNHLHFLFVLV